MYGKLEMQLYKKRNDIKEVIEVANSAYEERDKVQSKMAELILQSDKEQNEFNHEINMVQ